MTPIDPHFEALKSVTRLHWMLNFEALASVGNDEDALSWKCMTPRMAS